MFFPGFYVIVFHELLPDKSNKKVLGTVRILLIGEPHQIQSCRNSSTKTTVATGNNSTS